MTEVPDLDSDVAGLEWMERIWEGWDRAVEGGGLWGDDEGEERVSHPACCHTPRRNRRRRGGKLEPHECHAVWANQPAAAAPA